MIYWVPNRRDTAPLWQLSNVGTQKKNSLSLNNLDDSCDSAFSSWNFTIAEFMQNQPMHGIEVVEFFCKQLCGIFILVVLSSNFTDTVHHILQLFDWLS